MSFSRLRITLLLTPTILAGCASMMTIAPGTPVADVENRYGRAVYSCSRSQGEQRMIWSQQPAGQHAWAAEVNVDGRVQRVEAILTDDSFARLRVGMPDDELRCTFGPPAIVGKAGRGAQRRTVWSYRYREAKVWNSLMHVYFDTDGKVARFEPGPDSMFEEKEWFGGRF